MTLRNVWNGLVFIAATAALVGRGDEGGGHHALVMVDAERAPRPAPIRDGASWSPVVVSRRAGLPKHESDELVRRNSPFLSGPRRRLGRGASEGWTERTWESEGGIGYRQVPGPGGKITTMIRTSPGGAYNAVENLASAPVGSVDMTGLPSGSVVAYDPAGVVSARVPGGEGGTKSYLLTKDGWAHVGADGLVTPKTAPAGFAKASFTESSTGFEFGGRSIPAPGVGVPEKEMADASSKKEKPLSERLALGKDVFEIGADGMASIDLSKRTKTANRAVFFDGVASGLGLQPDGEWTPVDRKDGKAAHVPDGYDGYWYKKFRKGDDSFWAKVPYRKKPGGLWDETGIYFLTGKSSDVIKDEKVASK